MNTHHAAALTVVLLGLGAASHAALVGHPALRSPHVRAPVVRRPLHPTRAAVHARAHAVQDVAAVRAAVLLRSWQKQAEDSWAQGFTPTSNLDKMKRLSAQVKQLQRMAALARVMTVRSQAPTPGIPAPAVEGHFTPYLALLDETSIVAAVAPGNGTAIAFACHMPDEARAEMLHLESSPACTQEQSRNALRALLANFIERSSEQLPERAQLAVDAAPGSDLEYVLLERGFSLEGEVEETWMPDFNRYVAMLEHL